MTRSFLTLLPLFVLLAAFGVQGCCKTGGYRTEAPRHEQARVALSVADEAPQMLTSSQHATGRSQ